MPDTGTGIITERWERQEAVGIAVRQRIVPGVVGIITTDLTSGIQHQWRRFGVTYADANSLLALKANEGQSAVTTVVDTIRYGQVEVWLVKTRFPNLLNRYDPIDVGTQVTEYEQIWQES